MKRKFIALLSLLLPLLLFLSPTISIASNSFVAATCTIGGTAACLDGIHHLDIAGDGTNVALATGDIGVVITAADVTHHYRYDSTSGVAESDPDVVAPDSIGASNGRWIKAPGGAIVEDFGADVILYYNNATDLIDNITLGTGFSLSSGTLSLHANLVDIVGLTAEKGAMIYWDTLTTMGRLQFNVGDREGYILQATGANPNTVPDLTNTLDITKLLVPNAAGPTLDTTGQLVMNHTNDALEYQDDGSVEREVVATDLAQTLTNKDIALYELINITAQTYGGSAVRGRLINNYGASGNLEHNLPTAATDYNFMAVCGQATYDLSFDAYAGDNIYLDGTPTGTGDMVTMECNAKGDTMTCITFKTGAAQWDWICTCGEGTCVDGGTGT